MRSQKRSRKPLSAASPPGCMSPSSCPTASTCTRSERRPMTGASSSKRWPTTGPTPPGARPSSCSATRKCPSRPSAPASRARHTDPSSENPRLRHRQRLSHELTGDLDRRVRRCDPGGAETSCWHANQLEDRASSRRRAERRGEIVPSGARHCARSPGHPAVDRCGGDGRLARAQRRGQVDDDRHAARAAAARTAARSRCWADRRSRPLPTAWWARCSNPGR